MTPNLSVVNPSAGAPGYRKRQEMMKAHYRREVTRHCCATIAAQAAQADGGDSDGGGGE